MTADQIPTLPALPIAAHFSETTHTTPTMSKTTNSDGAADVVAPLAIDNLHPSHSSGNSRPAGSNEFDSQIKKAELSRAPAIQTRIVALGEAPETQSQEPPKTANQVIFEAFAKSGAIAAKVMSVIEAGFTATRPQFNKMTQAWDEIPDYKTRHAACELYLAHTVGLPIQRTENLNLTGKIPGQGVKRPPATPALLAYYARELEKAKRQGAGKAKPEEPASEA